jgi:hypothetical protein
MVIVIPVMSSWTPIVIIAISRWRAAMEFTFEDSALAAWTTITRAFTIARRRAFKPAAGTRTFAISRRAWALEAAKALTKRTTSRRRTIGTSARWRRHVFVDKFSERLEFLFV